MKIKVTVHNASNKIPAIKFYRFVTGAGLKDAKDAVEKIMREKLGSDVTNSPELLGKHYEFEVETNGVTIEMIRDSGNENSISVEPIDEKPIKDFSRFNGNFSVDFKGNIATLIVKSDKMDAKLIIAKDKLFQNLEWIMENF